MGNGLKRVAKQCGGLTVKSGGNVATFDSNGIRVLENGMRHASDCARHNEPAMPSAKCDCRRLCSKCLIVKPREEFAQGQRWCRSCKSKAAAAKTQATVKNPVR